jgi:benzodiazapine receptor
MDVKNAYLVLGIIMVLAYAIGSGYWVDNSGWYQGLNKPRWQPPDFIFGIIWPYNFLILALSIYQVTRAASSRQILLYLIFLGISVSCALAWSYFFYQPHNFDLASLALILAALFTLPLLAISFSISVWVGFALIPYQIWLILASALSLSYGRLN